MSAGRIEALRAVMRERERLITTARLMGASSPDGHITRGIDRHALAQIAAALSADDEAARQETPDPSAREAAEEWVATSRAYVWRSYTRGEEKVFRDLEDFFAQPRPVRDAIREVLSGGDQ